MAMEQQHPDNILEVEGLVTKFQTEGGWVTAVKGSTFTLGRGETLGIVGESGSGKSVSALSILQLLPQPAGKITSGSIRFQSPSNGWVDLAKLPPNQLRQYRGKEISMIFQEPMTSLNPVHSCGAQVMEAIMLHQGCDKATAKEKTIELFQQVKLPRPEAIFNAYPHQISGGQKQRVMIAMAISCEPSILIADEPTTALDVTVQKTILELMVELQEKHGMAIIFITHDLGVVAEIADKVLVMYKGEIVEHGESQQIFENPKHPYTKGLLACRPKMEFRLKRLPVISDFMQLQPDGSLQEMSISVQESISSAKVSPEEHKKRQEDLASRSPILEVRNLKTWFPLEKSLLGKVKSYVKAVDDVSFSVYPGETMGLVGESGCGKTTLGRSILRLQEPTAGQVFFEGKELTAMSNAEMRLVRKDLQIIFQDPYSSLNPRIMVGNAILEPMEVHGLNGNKASRKEKVMDLLEKVGLGPEHFYRYPHEFSGGQRQRIVIARALAVEPKFIICDESVSALDVSVQAQVLNLLVGLRQEFGFSYIFVSHDLSVVKFISDRMIVMNKGKIEEMGLADEIYAHPSKEYTKDLIAAIPGGDSASVAKAIAKRKARKAAL